MTLGDDPFRKRDVPPAQDPGTQPPPYASSPYGAPPYGSQPPGSQPPGSQPPGSQPPGSQPPGSQPYGSQPYGSQQPYGYQPYGTPYPPYGSQYAPSGQPPPGHLGWAITAILFFWPLAIAAFINYSRVESRWYRGDPAGAQQASDAVKRYGIIALCVGLAIMVLYIILFASAFVSTCTGTNC
jgi:hypothetical protein